ncbi:MAG TPA: AMP-dependent synthetase [Clostridiales bacterium]|nr:AMP-dependent synthetase [Clostridiales bacterium]
MNNLIEFLENTVKTKAGDVAVSAADGTFTFGELRSEALRIAGHIAKSGTRGRTVAVYMPKGSKCLCAMLGVLYSGNIYVPLDCRAPINRTMQIFEIVQPLMIISDGRYIKTLVERGVNGDTLADYDTVLAPDIALNLAQQTISLSQDVDPAYILFTSGSTGVPKGVVIPHKRVINYINWARNFFSIQEDDVIGSQAPFYFTVSAMDIYLCLSTGARLEIIPEHMFSQPTMLMKHLDKEGISLIFWVSSVYRHIVQSGALTEIQPRSLKHAWFVGEPMSVDVLSYLMGKLPNVGFANLYGSTETDMTICRKFSKNDFPMDSIPLGYPCANTDVLILKDGELAGDGEIGEICVHGPCLALGYYKDSEKTRSVFVQNPLHNNYPDIIYRTGDLGEIRDGQIFFHGRKDHQFKHLGYRIEAGEIETTAEKLEGIKSVCVLYDNVKRQIIMLYEANGLTDELTLRRALIENLPAYMIPTRYIHLDSMPYNANNKKDRIALAREYMKEEI